MANPERTRKDGTPIRRKPRQPRGKHEKRQKTAAAEPTRKTGPVRKTEPVKPFEPPKPLISTEQEAETRPAGVPFRHSAEHMAKMNAAAAAAASTFETEEEFDTAAEAYFDYCDANGMLYGEAGLCLALSKGNRKGRTVTLQALRDWYDGKHCEYLQDAVQRAYLRIQAQIETDPTYREKGMVPRSIFLQKQTRLGGYQDKVETKSDATVKVIFGSGVDESDFK